MVNVCGWASGILVGRSSRETSRVSSVMFSVRKAYTVISSPVAVLLMEAQPLSSSIQKPRLVRIVRSVCRVTLSGSVELIVHPPGISSALI